MVFCTKYRRNRIDSLGKSRTVWFDELSNEWLFTILLLQQFHNNRIALSIHQMTALMPPRKKGYFFIRDVHLYVLSKLESLLHFIHLLFHIFQFHNISFIFSSYKVSQLWEHKKFVNMELKSLYSANSFLIC